MSPHSMSDRWVWVQWWGCALEGASQVHEKGPCELGSWGGAVARPPFVERWWDPPAFK